MDLNKYGIRVWCELMWPKIWKNGFLLQEKDGKYLNKQSEYYLLNKKLSHVELVSFFKYPLFRNQLGLMLTSYLDKLLSETYIVLGLSRILYG